MYIYCLKFDRKLDNKTIDRLKELADEDPKNTLISKLLVKYLLHKIYHKRFEDIKFKYNEYGKPFINSNEEICFNISHSGSYLVCAIDNNTIGIDIQKIISTNLRIADRFFTKEECDYINSNKTDKLSCLIELWTMKESYIKALGTGLSTPLNSFSVIQDKEIIHKGYEFYFYRFCIDKDYKMSVCCKNAEINHEVIYIDQQNFISELLEYAMFD